MLNFTYSQLFSTSTILNYYQLQLYSSRNSSNSSNGSDSSNSSSSSSSSSSNSSNDIIIISCSSNTLYCSSKLFRRPEGEPQVPGAAPESGGRYTMI